MRELVPLTNAVAAGMNAAPNPVLYDFVELYGPSTIARVT